MRHAAPPGGLFLIERRALGVHCDAHSMCMTSPGDVGLHVYHTEGHKCGADVTFCQNKYNEHYQVQILFVAKNNLKKLLIK